MSQWRHWRERLLSPVLPSRQSLAPVACSQTAHRSDLFRFLVTVTRNMARTISDSWPEKKYGVEEQTEKWGLKGDTTNRKVLFYMLFEKHIQSENWRIFKTAASGPLLPPVVSWWQVHLNEGFHTLKICYNLSFLMGAAVDQQLCCDVKSQIFFMHVDESWETSHSLGKYCRNTEIK